VVSWKCHCRDCQRACGSAFYAALYVSQAALKISDEIKYYDVKGESGITVSRGFCPQYGSPVLAKAGRWPEFIALCAASLDDPMVCACSGDVVEKPIPAPGPTDAVIKTTASLICTSDVHIVRGVIPLRCQVIAETFIAG
jgi:hypothetical protein